MHAPPVLNKTNENADPLDEPAIRAARDAVADCGGISVLGLAPGLLTALGMIRSR
jgi:hypothetical protein